MFSDQMHSLIVAFVPCAPWIVAVICEDGHRRSTRGKLHLAQIVSFFYLCLATETVTYIAILPCRSSDLLARFQDGSACLVGWRFLSLFIQDIAKLPRSPF